MRVAVTNAKGQLTELIRRAEAGEEVILTMQCRSGHPSTPPHAGRFLTRYGNAEPPRRAPSKMPRGAKTSFYGTDGLPEG